MSRAYEEIKLALLKPLQFGARKGGENFRNIKNFSQVILGLLSEAKSLPLPPDDGSFVANLCQDFEGFEAKTFAEQKVRVQKALARFDSANPPLARSKPQPRPVESSGDLHLPMTVVHGVGKAFAKRLERKNILVIEDALLDLPLRYEDRTALLPIAQVQEGKLCTIRGSVLSSQVTATRRGMRILTVMLQDASGAILAKWFSYRGKVPDKRFEKGKDLIVSGLVGLYQGRLEFHHPEIEPMEESFEAGEEEDSKLLAERIVPIYSLTEGLPQRYYRGVMRRVAQDYAHLLPDVLPDTLKEKFHLPLLGESIFLMHCPDKDTDLALLNQFRSPAQRRVIFEELFFLGLSIEMRKQGISQLPAVPMPAPKDSSQVLTGRFLQQISFSLTKAQVRVLQQIAQDLQRPLAMNRLLQGDVGSGKTIVALLTALRVIENHHQVALMAPTEILAEQHYLTLAPLLAGVGVRAVCLTGSTVKSKREEMLAQIAKGEVAMVMGTHALLEEDVRFDKLGLVIVDEQHRFGVLQRVALRKKGFNPHALVMTATPIPRTLAMTVYGDLDLSILDEMPPGRLPIQTKLYRYSDRAKLYAEIAREVRSGHQVYVVYPLIEESETLDLKNAMAMFEELSQKTFPQFHLALLHGRMKTAEKEEVMSAFKQGQVQILVSTTVIEVGIDIPNATLMVIENAERFGLSQLHQLRGRVGRGALQSKCVLLVEKRLTPEARKRLHIMVETNDGFRIAEEDLRIRGPGEVLGTRQAGLPTFCYAELRRDADILQEASDAAKELLAMDPQLQKPEHQKLRHAMQAKWQGRLQLSRIG